MLKNDDDYVLCNKCGIMYLWNQCDCRCPYCELMERETYLRYTINNILNRWADKMHTSATSMVTAALLDDLEQALQMGRNDEKSGK